MGEVKNGPLAQWCKGIASEEKIVGSNLARVKDF
jgi:hypothetical protein